MSYWSLKAEAYGHGNGYRFDQRPTWDNLMDIAWVREHFSTSDIRRLTFLGQDEVIHATRSLKLYKMEESNVRAFRFK